ncbi:MAG: ATP synthase subunit delta [Isosphaeraceae bacterium]|jgi:F-type H+-transporting ATPase subunit delta|nr:MAG: ATP synthase subunit delta [Isosphaeraceae bacterium]
MSEAEQTKVARLKEAARHATVLDDTAATGARAYAEALLNVADRQGKAEAIVEELEEFQEDVLDAHPRLADILRSPTLGVSEKDGVLVRLLEGRADELTVRFLRLLNRNGRLELLGTILRQARELLNRRRKRRAVRVTSAVELSEDQRRELEARLREQMGTEPVVEYEVDPALLGGLVVRVGDVLYDASVRGQLKRLRRRLVEERSHQLRGMLAGLVDGPVGADGVGAR